MRFFGKLVLFSVMTALWVGLVDLLLVVPAGDIYKDGAAHLCERKRQLVRSGALGYQPGRVNVVFMGDSRILCGIVPALFEQAVGGRTYALNLALPALPIGPHYFELQEYLRRGPPPEYLVLAITVNRGRFAERFDHYANQGLWVPDELLSYVLLRRDFGVGLRYLLPMAMYGDYVYDYLRDLLLHPSEIRRLRAFTEDNLREMAREQGHYAIGGTTRLDVVGGLLLEEEPDRQILAFSDDPYVARFLDLCRSRGIRVLLTEPPARREERRPRSQMPWPYRDLLTRYANVRMAPGGWRGRIYDGDLFVDSKHVMPAGALRFTLEVAAEFRESWGAP